MPKKGAPGFFRGCLHRPWIAASTEVTGKAGLTLLVLTAFFVALLAPNTSGMVKNPCIPRFVPGLGTKVPRPGTKIPRFGTNLGMLPRDDGSLRVGKKASRTVRCK